MQPSRHPNAHYPAVVAFAPLLLLVASLLSATAAAASPSPTEHRAGINVESADPPSRLSILERAADRLLEFWLDLLGPTAWSAAEEGSGSQGGNGGPPGGSPGGGGPSQGSDNESATSGPTADPEG